MNQPTDKKKLLADVFTEASPASFRETLLDETLWHVRRQRRWRQTRQATLLVALGIFAVFFLRSGSKPTTAIAVKPTAKIIRANYQLVRTEVLPARARVTTQPLAAARVIASAVGERIVSTTHGNYRVLNDDQLLALARHRPAALIRTDANSERLVFTDPADENGFPMP